MDTIRTAVILLAPLSSGYRVLFNRDIAGLSLFKRLVLTLQRAGIEEFIVLSKHLPEDEWAEFESHLKSDFRFQGQLSWFDQNRFLKTADTSHLRFFKNTDGFLVLPGNLVTTPESIKEFIRQARWAGPANKPQIAQLTCSKEDPAKVFIFSPNSAEQLVHFLRNKPPKDAVRTVEVERESFLLKTVEDIVSLRQAEKELIQKHKFHYSQIMDIAFNSLFSLKISSFLVKTSLTPNQITLLGLLIGLSAGWFFSLGNYLGGLFGGILLAGTAIWDCCDGDVARLKFMESDFGETLDTTCDNIINVFIFTGMMIGTARSQGMISALVPFSLLVIGGTLIFVLIYFPKGGKGNFFKDTWIYGVIQVLASRNFIYIILVFAVFGRVDWFLWVAGIGSNLFALALFITKRNILSVKENSQHIHSSHPSPPPE